MRSILILLVFFLCMTSFIAGDYMSDIRFKYLPLCDIFGDMRVVDGDTIDCGGIRDTVCEYKNQVLNDEKLKCKGRMLRIDGIDAPEVMRANCTSEKKLGVEAKALLGSIIKSGGCRISWNGKRDSFGRYMSDVNCKGRNIAEELKKQNLAKSWNWPKETKPNWCPPPESILPNNP